MGNNYWGFRVNCPICGRFDLIRETWDDYLDPNSPVGQKFSVLGRARLSHVVKTATVLGPSGLPRLDSDFLKRFEKDGGPGPSPAEQALKAIKFIGDFVSETGERLEQLPPDFYAIIGAPSPAMAVELTIELKQKGLIDGVPAKSMGTPGDLLNVNLTLDGWEQYEAEKRGKVSGNYGFIAMQFEDSILDPFVEEVLKPAVKDGIGYDVLDMRNVARAGIIDNIMRSQIRDAAFVIVDLTHDNSGAYWEAGYAEGLGKPVIYICEKNKFEEAKTHFDTNHCTTVLWTQGRDEDFCHELIATLRRSLNLFPGA
ncbi:MAG: hypothetical protein IH905_08365 [Proteobacteria bacterium]|nr:hypothetical protein [Pseudomonadota bacterium]